MFAKLSSNLFQFSLLFFFFLYFVVYVLDLHKHFEWYIICINTFYSFKFCLWNIRVNKTINKFILENWFHLVSFSIKYTISLCMEKCPYCLYENFYGIPVFMLSFRNIYYVVYLTTNVVHLKCPQYCQLSYIQCTFVHVIRKI